MDLWGPASVETITRKKYSLDFIDDATRWTETSYLAAKSECFKYYCDYETALEVQYGVRIKILRCDRAGEFMSEEFEEHLKRRGTRREFTVHDTHEQVGVAERYNRTKLELSRAIMFCSGLPMYLWAEAKNHTKWIKNRAPTRALDGSTPFQARFGKTPDLSELVPFGTRAWVKIHSAGKLEPRARLGYFVGYDDTSTGYKIYYPERRTVGVEREVVFDTSPRDVIEVPIDDLPIDSVFKEKLGSSGGGEEKVDEDQGEEPSVQEAEEENDEGLQGEGHEQESEVRTMRTRGGKAAEPDYYWKLAGKPRRTGQQANISLRPEDTLFALSSALETAPYSIQESLAGPHASEWKDAWKV